MISPRRLAQRSALLAAVRSFFRDRGYLEADTPIRLPVLLPEAHIKPFSAEGWYLHTSPEPCMKRLLARGNTKLFQICHCFRKEEEGRHHQTEFSLLEWYRTGWSYGELMEECEEFIRWLVRAVPALDGVAGPDVLRRQGRAVSLESPWERLTVEEAFLKYAGMPAREALRRDMFDELLVTRVEPRLGWRRPVFLYDYPAELASLARKKEGDPTVAERFELYIAGIELVNGFSELTDPDEQRRRFALELDKSAATGSSYREMPEAFLADLGCLPETAGAALGFDRLCMILMGCPTVADAMCLLPDPA
ncbi:MAG: EF-P lysine aminoacylase EpmA [Desulfobulbaceae bacterium]|nr:EF-P lysine aminoacylase EpmA [Desulfobulbaceae bacterium]MDY0350395.1 EF-P lysine aminoacylase EpmA [Desulfobulbaceae bacterium]